MGLWIDRIQNEDGLKKKSHLDYFEKASFAFRMKSGDRTENLTELRHSQLVCLTGT